MYWSRYGNGKKLVETLAEQLKEKGNTVKTYKVDEVDPASMPPADVYIFSAPTEAFRIQADMRTFMNNLQGVDGNKYGVINTHAMKRNWLKSMEKTLSKKNMVKLAGVDFKVGKGADKEPVLVEGWEEKLQLFAEKLK